MDLERITVIELITDPDDAETLIPTYITVTQTDVPVAVTALAFTPAILAHPILVVSQADLHYVPVLPCTGVIDIDIDIDNSVPFDTVEDATNICARSVRGGDAVNTTLPELIRDYQQAETLPAYLDACLALGDYYRALEGDALTPYP
ncbi:MAG: hypothetical protein AAFU67_09615, partial [Bacteroidota bacterium]